MLTSQPWERSEAGAATKIARRQLRGAVRSHQSRVPAPTQHLRGGFAPRSWSQPSGIASFRLKEGHLPAAAVRKPLSPPPKQLELLQEEQNKTRTSLPDRSARSRSPARLRAAPQTHPRRPRWRQALPPSRGGLPASPAPFAPGKRTHPRRRARTRQAHPASSPKSGPAASPVTQDPDSERRKWARRDLNTLRLKLTIQLLR